MFCPFGLPVDPRSQTPAGGPLLGIRTLRAYVDITQHISAPSTEHEASIYSDYSCVPLLLQLGYFYQILVDNKASAAELERDDLFLCVNFGLFVHLKLLRNR